MTTLILLASLYLPVYSPKAASPLHVAEIDTNTMAFVQSWTFPSAYTGHRSVCFLPNASSNMTFAAWTGDDSYDADADSFGVSSGYTYPVLGVTRRSPITPRFDLWEAGTMQVNAVTNIGGGALSEDSVRVRVVRWKIDDVQRYRYGDTKFPSAAIVLDKIVDARASRMLTEADFIDESHFDIDWDHFYDDVMVNSDAAEIGYPVVKAEYLVLFGYGSSSWESSRETNTWVTASQRTITRYYGKDRVLPTPVSPCTNGLVIVNTANPTFSWTIDCPDREAYTAFRVVVTNEDTQAFYDTGIKRMPPRDMSGVYSWVAPADTNLWQSSSAFAGRTNSWMVQAYNSKFRADATNSVRTLFYIPATSTTP